MNREIAAFQSATTEIRRQFNQAYALVTAARGRLLARPGNDEVAAILLDLAEDVLAELEYLDRIDPPEVTPGA